MPIKIPDRLPARAALEAEGVAVMDERTAIRQDIRPLNIGLLNLMPNKPETETQFARLIGATPLQVDLTLVHPASHTAKSTPSDYLNAFYRSWDEVKAEKFDGFIVTGAPLGGIPFEEVTYWDEFKQIVSWMESHVHAALFVCWGAMAALYHLHGIPKRKFTEKAFGVYPHKNEVGRSKLLLGFDDLVEMPISRWTYLDRGDVSAKEGLDILLSHEETGPGLIEEKAARRVYLLNHLEYDADTLLSEHLRDLDRGEERFPLRYFPGDDPSTPPPSSWRSHGHLLVANWINDIYQSVPFDPADIGR